MDNFNDLEESCCVSTLQSPVPYCHLEGCKFKMKDVEVFLAWTLLLLRHVFKKVQNFGTTLYEMSEGTRQTDVFRLPSSQTVAP